MVGQRGLAGSRHAGQQPGMMQTFAGRRLRQGIPGLRMAMNPCRQGGVQRLRNLVRRGACYFFGHGRTSFGSTSSRTRAAMVCCGSVAETT